MPWITASTVRRGGKGEKPIAQVRVGTGGGAGAGEIEPPPHAASGSAAKPAAPAAAASSRRLGSGGGMTGTASFIFGSLALIDASRTDPGARCAVREGSFALRAARCGGTGRACVPNSTFFGALAGVRASRPTCHAR
jgi:hypothetical protein